VLKIYIYILQVSSFFRDPSIGNRINIVVVKMAFMDEASEVSLENDL
jgi:hypothetical protein